MAADCETDRPGSEAVEPQPRVSIHHLDPRDPDAFARLARELAGPLEVEVLAPLQRILEVERLGGCETVLVEERYVDLDYRSDYSAFWSRRHTQLTEAARRLHFFAMRIGRDEAHVLPAAAQDRYLGYSVLRPTPLGPVGRTVLKPPPAMKLANLCMVEETPSLYGVELPIRGVPFSQQDGEFLRCAHAAAWLCHYVAWSRGVIPRMLSAEIAGLPAVERSKHRPLPSSGLTTEQLQGVFSTMGIPAVFYDVNDLPEPPAPLEEPADADRGIFERQKSRSEKHAATLAAHGEEVQRERLLRIACKYLNSGFPVVVFTRGEKDNHAFTLVGWQQTPDGVQLIACDDQVGPYETIDDVLDKAAPRGGWTALMIPLPELVHLDGEAAETRSRSIAIAQARLAQDSDGEDVQGTDFGAFAERLRHLRKGISIRSRLLRGRDLKAALVERQHRTGDALRLYRLADLSEWVWLVEFQDTARQRNGENCVIAEVVFDSTSHDLNPVTSLSSTLRESRDNALIRADAPAELSIAPGAGADEPWPSLINPRPRAAGAAEMRPPLADRRISS